MANVERRIAVIEGNKPSKGGQRNDIIKPELVVRLSCGAALNRK
jgi:hypothetical protein